MILDELKEKTAKKICLYLADLIDKGGVKMVEIAKVSHFLITGVEGAEDKEELKNLETEMKEVYPNLPAFSVGL